MIDFILISPDDSRACLRRLHVTESPAANARKAKQDATAIDSDTLAAARCELDASSIRGM
jgi:hypothetical protein